MTATASSGPRLERMRRALGDLRVTIGMVWSSSPILFFLTIGLSIVSALVPAATLWVGKLLLDEVALAVRGGLHDTASAYRQLSLLLALQVGLGAASSLINTISTTTRLLLTDTLENKTKRQILEKAATLDVMFFERPETYDALRNANGEGGTQGLETLGQFVAVGQALITLASIGTLIASLGANVMVLVVVATVPSVVVSSRFAAESYWMMRGRATDERHQTYLGSLLTSDMLVKEVRLFAFERFLLDGWQKHYRAFRAELVRQLTRRSAWSLVASLVSTSLIAVATLSVLRRAANGTISVGDFSLFAIGIVQVQSQFSILLGSVSRVHDSLRHMRTLFEFLELPSRDLNAGEEWHGPIERIEFDRVSFCYPSSRRNALNDVSFSIERGQVLALVGENGAGKSTIVMLLTRLFEPSSGRILINGMDASRFSPRSVQREMSVVFQDYGHYQMTARENIALSDVAALGDDDRIERAGRLSGAVEIVEKLPNRYEAMLGRVFPGGRQLSGGQWQRLALARLYFRSASVQIFDEPTTSLDTTAAARTIEQLHAHAPGRITLLISHRFSTVRRADRILVLDEGTIVESGSHDELLSLDGRYSRNFSRQAEGYVEASAPAFRRFIPRGRGPFARA